MDGHGTSQDSRIHTEIAAEAATWLVILNGPDRTEEAERGFEQWMGVHPDHRRIYAQMNQIWKDSSRLSR